MRPPVASKRFLRPALRAAALAAICAVVPLGAAMADAKVRSVTAAQSAAARADVEKVAAAEAKPKDPLANLSVSDRMKALQERADQVLAENGESRVDDDEEAEAAFSTSLADKPKELAAPKPQAKAKSPGIQCLAGCE